MLACARGEDAAGPPTRVVDAWEVSARGVAYWPIPVTSNLWERSRCGSVPDVIRAVLEGHPVGWWREHVGQWQDVTCTRPECGARGHVADSDEGETEADAVDAWNRREG